MITQLLLSLFLMLQALLAWYLLQPALMLLLHYLRKAFYPYRSPMVRKPLLAQDFDFAAIVTAHGDVRFIPPLVDSLRKQHYRRLHVYVVADDCDASTLPFFGEDVTVLVPPVPFHAKTKSIQYAVDSFVRQHDALVIFDSDNLVHPKYFTVLNAYFRQGYKAVQTQMLSKNTGTRYARLDSIGHIFYSFADRQMRMELGMSAHILGLGIAVDCRLYREIMYRDGLGGFDKVMQAELVKRLPQVAYAAEAIVYDEKVDDGATLEKQRTRWMFTYFHYFGVHAGLLANGLRRLRPNVIYFGLATLRPPIIMQLAGAVVCGLLCLIMIPSLAWAWLSVLLLYPLSFVLIILTQSSQKGMASALLHLPVFALRQVKSLLRIRSAGKSFLQTQHRNLVYIEELLP